MGRAEGLLGSPSRCLPSSGSRLFSPCTHKVFSWGPSSQRSGAHVPSPVLKVTGSAVVSNTTHSQPCFYISEWMRRILYHDTQKSSTIRVSVFTKFLGVQPLLLPLVKAAFARKSSSYERHRVTIRAQGTLCKLYGKSLLSPDACPPSLSKDAPGALRSSV